VSEAAASLLDTRLGLNIVPKTDLVSFSSTVRSLLLGRHHPFLTTTHNTQTFFYDWIDRSAAKKGKSLPDKIGSMQYFMHGFTGASFPSS
jgi:hypothetical protein